MSDFNGQQLEFFNPDTATKADLPLSASGVSAGFPSQADDHIEMSLDLNRELIRNPAATFFARVQGVSMIDDGIDDGDLLVIDKSVVPFEGCLAVCYIDGEFTLKRVRFEADCVWLVPANKKYKPLRVTADNEFLIWGLVRYVIKKM